MTVKTVFRNFLSLVLLAGLLLSETGTAFAQGYVSGDLVTFDQLQVGDISLKGPLEAESLRFTLPANWALTSGAEMHLNMSVFAGDAVDNAPGSVRPVSGFLSIRVNSTWVQTITLDHTGDYSLVIPIPSDAWLTTPRNARQTIRFSLESAQSCDMIMAALSRGIFTGLNALIHPTSFLVLPHTEDAEIPLDLKLFPYPLYQKTFIPDHAVLVMPQQPSEMELQAAITTASALGYLTQKNLLTTFVTADKLDPVALNESNVVFVGKPEAFPAALEASWPVTPVNGAFPFQQIEQDDGVIQLAVSPRNPARAWLMVSGKTDAGVLKAAQALGGAIQPISRPDLAIVANVSPQTVNLPRADVTFADLGYSDQTFIGYNDLVFDYWFDVPLDTQVSNGAYLDLIYSNSSLLNFEEVSLTFKLNDQFIGGLRFNERTNNSTQFRFNIPNGAFKSGSNLVSLVVSLKGATPCVRNDDVWAAVSSLSTLHIPVEPVPADSLPDFQFVSYPKRIFPFHSNTAFVLAQDDPASWTAAARLAFHMGGYRRGPFINPDVVTSTSLTEAMRQQKDLVLVGRASTLPVLQDIAARMPAPFAPGVDEVADSAGQVAFRVSADSDLGYLEVFPSPWNPRRAVLLVAGNSTNGLESAISAITDTDRLIYTDLIGNFAVVAGLQLSSRLLEIQQPETVLPASGQSAALPDAQTPQAQPFSLDLVTVGIILVVIVVMLMVVYWLIKRQGGN